MGPAPPIGIGLASEAKAESHSESHSTRAIPHEEGPPIGGGGDVRGDVRGGPAQAQDPEAAAELSETQRYALERILDGTSVFLTGPAGTGKSFLTRRIVAAFEARGTPVVLAASTGIAASHIGGVTLHSMLRLPAIDDALLEETLVRRYREMPFWAATDAAQNPFLEPQDYARAFERMRAAALTGTLAQTTLRPTRNAIYDEPLPMHPSREYYEWKAVLLQDAEFWAKTPAPVLVLDEVSMVSKNLFTGLDVHLRMVRGMSDARWVRVAFGGVQLVAVGDFYQLKPVKGDFAFESRSWAQGAIETVFLETQWRQAADDPLLDILDALRANAFRSPAKTQRLLRLLETRIIEGGVGIGGGIGGGIATGIAMAPDPLQITTLVANKAEATRINETCQRMIQLANGILERDVVTYKGVDVVESWTKRRGRGSLSHAHAHSFAIGVGGEDRNADDDRAQTVRVSVDTRVLCTRNVMLDGGVRVYNGMIGTVVGFVARTTVDEKVYAPGGLGQQAAITQLAATQWAESVPQIPLVLFPELEARTGIGPIAMRGVIRETRQIERGAVVVTGVHVELGVAPAWAITIHKSQGLTISPLKVRLARVFVESQVYVALSRARRLSEIFIEGGLPMLTNRAWTIDARVVAWSTREHERSHETRARRIARERATRRLVEQLFWAQGP